MNLETRLNEAIKAREAAITKIILDMTSASSASIIDAVVKAYDQGFTAGVQGASKVAVDTIRDVSLVAVELKGLPQ